MDESPPLPTPAPPAGEASAPDPAQPVRLVMDAANGYDDAELAEILRRCDRQSVEPLCDAYRELLAVYRLQRTFRRPMM